MHKKILVIDDDRLVCSLLEETLTEEGYDVIVTNSAEQGVSLYQKNRIDLVITDIIMPDKEGLETIRELIRLSPHIKIIAMSGGGIVPGEEYLAIASRMGASCTLSKPFNREELLQAIAKTLDTDG